MSRVFVCEVCTRTFEASNTEAEVAAESDELYPLGLEKGDEWCSICDWCWPMVIEGLTEMMGPPPWK